MKKVSKIIHYGLSKKNLYLVRIILNHNVSIKQIKSHFLVIMIFKIRITNTQKGKVHSTKKTIKA